MLIYLIDDAGYGTSSAFGGLMETPTLDSLANHGLRYTNFHTTAICGPTRAALLTGRNHHSVHMGYFNYSALGFPGYDARMPFDKATIARILQVNHYNTYAVGKYHLLACRGVDEGTDLRRRVAAGRLDDMEGDALDAVLGQHLDQPPSRQVPGSLIGDQIGKAESGRGGISCGLGGVDHQPRLDRDLLAVPRVAERPPLRDRV